MIVHLQLNVLRTHVHALFGSLVTKVHHTTTGSQQENNIQPHPPIQLFLQTTRRLGGYCWYIVAMCTLVAWKIVQLGWQYAE